MWRTSNRQKPSALLVLLLALLAQHIPRSTAVPTPGPQLPPGAQIQEDSGQVTINGDPSGIENSPSIPNLPITATIFSGVPGPKTCRGHVIFHLDIPPPPKAENDTDIVTATDNDDNSTVPKCYNLPTPAGSPAGCGNFVANKEDGCEIRFFAEPYCRLYTNTAVFVPEQRSVGGLWRSVEVRCGVTPPDPESLGKPPLQDLMRQQGMGLRRAR
ncbi:hypothetical protein V8F33_012219 [Rhypophila sp. PSN 637]